ncbi:hypothetical protein Tco_1346174 [Tanacetum coccineum]
MHNNIMAQVQGIVHQCLQHDDMHNGDHGSYDTLIQDQMVMPYESAFLKSSFESKKEAIHFDIDWNLRVKYTQLLMHSTAQEMWKSIERLQQGESLNIQDVKTNLFWEFGQFTSHDGETIESYYTRFYKMMNEMIRNNLTVATMQVNVQFLQQLQPEWSRFCHNWEANNTNWIMNLNEALMDKDNAKNLALIAKYFKKLYEPYQQQPQNSSNTRNKNVKYYSKCNSLGYNVLTARNLVIMLRNAESQNRLKTPRITRKRCCCVNKLRKVFKLQQSNRLATDTDEGDVINKSRSRHYSNDAKIQEVPNAYSGMI